MAATLTFDQVFTKEGEKNGKSWKRWDFKFGDDRYSTFQKKLADKITVGEPATIEFDVTAGSNGYTNRTITAVLASQGVEPYQESSSSPEAVKTAPMASGGPSERETQIHRQTASKVAAQLLQYFDPEERTLDTFYVIAEQLVDYFANGQS